MVGVHMIRVQMYIIEEYRRWRNFKDLNQIFHMGIFKTVMDIFGISKICDTYIKFGVDFI